MSEWSDYFEDFPEENPANQVDGRYDPAGAAAARAAEAKRDQVVADSRALQREMFRMRDEAVKRAAAERGAKGSSRK